MSEGAKTTNEADTTGSVRVERTVRREPSRAEELLDSRGFNSKVYQDWLAVRIAETSGHSRVPMHALAGIALGKLKPVSLGKVRTRYHNALNRRLMSDAFIAGCIGTGVRSIPKCLIELKRTQLRIKRLIREIKNDQKG